MTPDLLVIGGGAAGLMAALGAAPLHVTVIAKPPDGGGSSSNLAQGGIAAAMVPGDTPAAHAQDTLTAGAGLCDPDAVAFLTGAAPRTARRLIDLGVPFDRNPDGTLILGREGAHRERRILHAGGDATGRAIMRTLGRTVAAADHVTLRGGWVARRLIVRDGRVAGAWVRTPEGGHEPILARAVLLATGGIGRLYAKTTNPVTAAGDGLAMAACAGAALADLEFVQFHPTAMDVGGDPLPLATEALRGEGALLVDDEGHRFMVGVHADAELAPRDVVARAIWRQRAAGRRIFLDTRTSVGAAFAQRFPTVYGHCRAAGIDPLREPIPVVPAVHYHMGGVAVDRRGRTSLPGLWAGGEVACSGVHGANRLASNGILEAVVYGEAIAEDLLGETLPAVPEEPGEAPPADVPWDAAATERLAALRKLAYDSVGVVREGAGLQSVLAALRRMAAAAADGPPVLRDAIRVVTLIGAAAWSRQESRGSHFRADFADPDPAKAVRATTTAAKLDRIADLAAANER